MGDKHTISNGFYGDLETWVLDEDVQSKRYRVRNIPENGLKKWELYYFTHIIPLNDGDTLIGLQYGGCEDSEKAIFYHRLSSLEFCYYENDQRCSEENMKENKEEGD